jgi:16S rRNA (adenine(1408)-N(1))-methyltransferase
VIVDLGTGDGRAVLARAAAEPRAMIIGIDANAAGMAGTSRRAARGRSGRGPNNAIFLAEAAEGLPGFLAETASLVTITMPWGSLLRGVLGLDHAALRGVATIVAPGGRVEILASVVAADHVDGVEALDRTARAAVASAWRPLGFELESLRPTIADDLRSTRSSWARRLGERPVWRIDLRRDGLHGGHDVSPSRRSFRLTGTIEKSTPSAKSSRGQPRARAQDGRH